MRFDYNLWFLFLSVENGVFPFAIAQLSCTQFKDVESKRVQEAMNQGNTAGDIRAFIVRKFPAARKKPLDDGTPLLEAGIIDSLGILDVVAFLEGTFNIAISDDELIPENFADINGMAAFAERKQSRDQFSAT